MDNLKRQSIEIFDNSAQLFDFAAHDFYQRAIHGVQSKGHFSVVLSGGETPKLFFDKLTTNDLYRNSIPWQHIRFFFGDERYVASSDPRSNYHMAYSHLFSKINIPPDNIFPIPTDYVDPVLAAEKYEQTLRTVLSDGFDLTYLGLGENAHTASLMPDSKIVKLAATKRLDEMVTSLFVPEFNMFRITLTPSALNNSSCIIFLVEGEKKSKAVAHVIEGSYDPVLYPAQLIQCKKGNNLWFLDKAASSRLTWRK